MPMFGGTGRRVSKRLTGLITNLCNRISFNNNNNNQQHSLISLNHYTSLLLFQSYHVINTTTKCVRYISTVGSASGIDKEDCEYNREKNDFSNNFDNHDGDNNNSRQEQEQDQKNSSSVSIITKHKKSAQEIRINAQQFLNRLETELYNNNNNNTTTSQASNNTLALQAKQVLLDIVTSRSNYTDGLLASRILNIVTQFRPGSSTMNEIDKIVFVKIHSLTMQVWIRSKHPKTQYNVQELFWKLINNPTHFLLQNDVKKNNIMINDLFCLTINSLTQTIRRAEMSIELTKRVDTIINSMEELWNTYPTLVGPNTAAYNVILLTLMKQRNHVAACTLLYNMVDVWEKNHSNDDTVKPNQTSFDSTIVACAKSGKPESALKIVQLMINLHNKYPTQIPFPGPYNFTDLLVGFARCQNNNNNNNNNNTIQVQDVGQRAEETLRWIQDLHNNGQYKVIDGRKSMTYNINLVLHAWVTSESIDSAQRVHKILYNILHKFPFMILINTDTTTTSTMAEHNNNTVGTTTEPIVMTKTSTSTIYPDAISFWTVAHAWHRHAQRIINFNKTDTTLISNNEQQQLKSIDTAVIRSMELAKWTSMYVSNNNLVPINLSKIKETYEEIIHTCILLLQFHGQEERVWTDCNHIVQYMQELQLDTTTAESIMSTIKK